MFGRAQQFKDWIKSGLIRLMQKQHRRLRPLALLVGVAFVTCIVLLTPKFPLHKPRNSARWANPIISSEVLTQESNSNVVLRHLSGTAVDKSSMREAILYFKSKHVRDKEAEPDSITPSLSSNGNDAQTDKELDSDIDEDERGAIYRGFQKNISSLQNRNGQSNRSAVHTFRRNLLGSLKHNPMISWLSATTNASKTLRTIVMTLKDVQEEDYLASNVSFFQLRSFLVNSYVPTILIGSSMFCAANGPFLLIVVPSVDDHVSEREAIRSTWGSPAHGGKWPRRRLQHEVKVVFFLGLRNRSNNRLLVLESETYGDIVQADFDDSYRNLSLKMAAALYWSATYCPHAHHVMKVDEDTFVNLPVLLELLEVVSANRKRYVLGCRHFHSRPLVVRKGRWEVDHDVYPLQFFPNYLYGHSYVISGDAVSDLFIGYLRLPLIPGEDAYITGVLAKAMNVSRIHSKYFAFQNKYQNNRCKLLTDSAVTQTYFKPYSTLLEAWEMIQSGKCFEDTTMQFS